MDPTPAIPTILSFRWMPLREREGKRERGKEGEGEGKRGGEGEGKRGGEGEGGGSFKSNMLECRAESPCALNQK